MLDDIIQRWSECGLGVAGACALGLGDIGILVGLWVLASVDRPLLFATTRARAVDA